MTWSALVSGFRAAYTAVNLARHRGPVSSRFRAAYTAVNRAFALQKPFPIFRAAYTAVNARRPRNCVVQKFRAAYTAVNDGRVIQAAYFEFRAAYTAVNPAKTARLSLRINSFKEPEVLDPNFYIDAERTEVQGFDLRCGFSGGPRMAGIFALARRREAVPTVFHPAGHSNDQRR